MTQISEVMTRNVRSISPSESLQFAARTMRELDVGAIPVCDGERLVGMVTDRDITLRGVALGRPSDSTPVSEVMTGDVECCFEDEPLEEATEKMELAQIRRLPVLDREHKLVGLLALGDIAAKADAAQAAEALSRISEPAVPAQGGSIDEAEEDGGIGSTDATRH